MIYYGYSLEVPRRGSFNEYPQHVFVENWEKSLSVSSSYRYDPSKTSMLQKLSWVF